MKFHFALLGVLCAHALARDEGNKALKRAGTTTEAAWDDGILDTDLKSTLFGKCIISANTRKMQYFSIEYPGEGKLFRQYEVSRFATGLRPVKWDKEIQCKSILDCSKASKEYSMFQYNGQTCRMASATPHIDYGMCFCDDITEYKKDLVYIHHPLRITSCPANMDDVVGIAGTACIGGNHQAVPFDPAHAAGSCYCHYAGSKIYNDEKNVDFTSLRNYMRANKYQGEFLIRIRYDTTVEDYLWSNKKKLNTSYIAVQPQNRMFHAQAVISSSHDYLIVMKNNKDLITGFICTQQT